MDADESKRPPECASEFAASTARARADFEAPPSARTRAASGCSSPPTCAQLVAVVLVARSVAAFHLLAAPPRALALAEAALALGVALAWARASLVDPGRPLPLAAPRVAGRACAPCGGGVMAPDAKHCHTCAKCVGGFDHHCVWLDTCVGARNYLSFFATLAGALALFALHLARVGARAAGGAAGGAAGATAALVAAGALDALCALPLLLLLSFHVYLVATRRTTVVFLREHAERARRSPTATAG